MSLNISNEYSGLISTRIDWIDLLAVQGILKSLLQHHSSKASILWHSAFFIVQLSQSIHDYWKNHSFDLSSIIFQRSSFSKKCAYLWCDSLPVVILRNYHGCSTAQLCPTLFDPIDCSMPGFPILYHFPDLAQTHISWIHAKIMIQYDLWYMQRWWYKPLQGGLCYQKFHINLNVQNGSDLKNHSMFYPCFRVEL